MTTESVLHRSRRVVVVDDDPVTRMLICEALSMIGFAVDMLGPFSTDREGAVMVKPIKRDGWRLVGGKWTRSLGERGARVRLFEKRRNGTYYRAVWVPGRGRDQAKRAWFAVAREDLAATPLTFDEVKEVYDVPIWR